MHSVRLHVCTKLPNGEFVVVCQKRGEINLQQEGKRQSWPGALYPLVHSGVRQGEDPRLCLIRGTKAGLGEWMSGFLDTQKTDIHNFEEIEGVQHYGLMIDFAVLADIRLHPSSGGLCFIRRQDCDDIKNLRNFPEERPVPCLAMFLDDLIIVRHMFKIFDPQ